MAEPFIGEVKIVAFSFAPKYWANCDGQTLSIAQNQALYSLLLTTFGGDGHATFQLPDFRGRAPLHAGQTINFNNYKQGETGGAANVTLVAAQVPPHNHILQAASDPADTPSPYNTALATVATSPIYEPTSNALTTLAPVSVSTVGEGQAHTNMQPYQTLLFIIALSGIYPSRN